MSVSSLLHIRTKNTTNLTLFNNSILVKMFRVVRLKFYKRRVQIDRLKTHNQQLEATNVHIYS